MASDQDGNDAYPIIVTTHCSHLEAVLNQTCAKRWKDLVFVQNGMLQPWLYQHGLQSNTQALLFMSATPENPLEPKGRMKIKDGGQGSLVWGRWATVISQIMKTGGLECSTVTYGMFLEVMVEKLLWSSIFWLLSAALGGQSVGAIAKNCVFDIQELTSELLPLVRLHIKVNGVDDLLVDDSVPCQVAYAAGVPEMRDVSGELSLITDSEMVRRFCAYCMTIPDAVPSKDVAMSEFDFRNGWFLNQKITPCHVKWLKCAGLNSALWCKF